MSPQSRAASADNATFASRDDGLSCNACSMASSVAELARAANMEYDLHKIESESSAIMANPLVQQATCANTSSPSSSRKRSSANISSLPPPENEPFLSSYGSAFLSGIFADIAQASPDDTNKDGADPAAATAVASDSERCAKKARTAASTSFGRQPKSCMALAGLVEGAVSEVSSPSVVSPRPKQSILNIHLFNDQVRELQDMAFPSLPQIPIAVSTSSCSTSSPVIAPRDDVMGGAQEEEQDSQSYGWFVATDADEANTAMDQTESSAPMFLPDTKPDLAFNALSAPSIENQDLEVQQALAADTIDDVLGDLF